MYICPICDQAMKSKHYCRGCRQWVKTPFEREVTYYLNERHPQAETNCSYHSPQVRAKDRVADPKRPSEAVKNQMKDLKKKAQTAGTWYKDTLGNESLGKKENPIVKAISIIFTVLAILIALFG